MRKEELEYSIKQYVLQLINEVLPESGILGKLSNRTAKYWVEQNQWRLDEILSVFTDKDDCINTEKLAEMYEDEECKEILVLADLEGGLPVKLMSEMVSEMEKPIEIIAGTNLGMLIEISMARSFIYDLSELVEMAIETGKTQVNCIEK